MNETQIILTSITLSIVGWVLLFKLTLLPGMGGQSLHRTSLRLKFLPNIFRFVGLVLLIPSVTIGQNHQENQKTMNDTNIQLNDLITRNHNKAMPPNRENLPQKPRFTGVLISCMDARFDPVHPFGLKEGDAIVIRSIGGRITQDTLEHIAFLAAMAKKQCLETDRAPILEVALLHHTDCGAENFADPKVRNALAQGSGLPESTYASFAIHDHITALEEDIEKLKASPLVPDFVTIDGFLVDHETGRANPIQAASAGRSAHSER